MSVLDFNEQSIFLLEVSDDPTTPVWDVFMNLDISGAFPEDIPAIVADLSIGTVGIPRLFSQPVPEPGCGLLLATGLAGLAWRARRG